MRDGRRQAPAGTGDRRIGTSISARSVARSIGVAAEIGASVTAALDSALDGRPGGRVDLERDGLGDDGHRDGSALGLLLGDDP